MAIIYLPASKIRRVQHFDEHCTAIEAYISVGQHKRALPHLAELKQLYVNENRKIINIR